MSEIEKFESEYRAVATKVIYGAFEGDVSKSDEAELLRLADEIKRLNAEQSHQAELVAA
jgi:hypothetical protein